MRRSQTVKQSSTNESTEPRTNTDRGKTRTTEEHVYKDEAKETPNRRPREAKNKQIGSTPPTIQRELLLDRKAEKKKAAKNTAQRGRGKQKRKARQRRQTKTKQNENDKTNPEKEKESNRREKLGAKTKDEQTNNKTDRRRTTK